MKILFAVWDWYYGITWKIGAFITSNEAWITLYQNFLFIFTTLGISFALHFLLNWFCAPAYFHIIDLGVLMVTFVLGLRLFPLYNKTFSH